MATRLRILLVGGPMYDPLYERIPQWEQSSGVHVEIAGKLPHPALNERLRGEWESGTADYDLISTHTKYAPSQSRFLEPLDGYFSATELAEFSPAILKHSRIGGRLMGVPRNIDVKLLYYRSDLFSSPREQAAYNARFGRDLGIPKTWDELFDIAEFFTRPPEFYGFVFPGRYSGLFGHFFELDAMAGGKLFDGRLQAAFHDDAGRWALGFLAKIYAKACPPEVPAWHYDEVTRFFLEGRSAMTTDWPGGYHLFTNPETSKVAGRFDVALYPEGPAGIRSVYSGGFTFAVPAAVRHRDAALDLLRFLTSEESQYQEARKGAVSPRHAVQQRIREEAQPGSLDARRLELLDQAIAHFMLTPPQFESYPLVEDTIWITLQRAIVGEISIEDALASAVREINAITGRLHAAEGSRS